LAQRFSDKQNFANNPFKLKKGGTKFRNNGQTIINVPFTSCFTDERVKSFNFFRTIYYLNRVLLDNDFVQTMVIEKSAKRKSLGEGRMRTCEKASVATAGPKRTELMALGARHRNDCKENTLTLY